MPSTISHSSSKQDSQIETIVANAHLAWRRSALAAVMRLANKRETLTSADVLKALAKSNAQTQDLRALGSVMTEARDLGFIESAGLVRRRDGHNRGASTLWRSRLYLAKDSRPPTTERRVEVGPDLA